MKRLIYILTFLSLFLLEVASIKNMSLEGFGIREKTSVLLLSVFVMSFIGVLAAWSKQIGQQYLKTAPARRFCQYMLYAYSISLVHSIITPLFIDDYVSIIVPCVLFLCVFGFHSRYGESNQTHILFIVFFLGLAYYYLKYQRLSLLVGLQDVFHNNTSYFVLYFLPLLLFSRHNLVRIGGLVITLIAVVTSAKRGGTIAFGAGFVTYYLVSYYTSSRSRLNWWKPISIVFVFTLFYYIFWNVVSSTDYFLLERFTDANDEGARGRETIYQQVWEMIQGSSWVGLLFGHGWNQVMHDNPIGLSAHNDFLEIMYDLGLIALVLYLRFIVSIIRYVWHLVKKRSSYAAPMTFTLVVFLINSMVSHIALYHTFLMLFAVSWGYALGINSLQQNHIKTKKHIA